MNAEQQVSGKTKRAGHGSLSLTSVLVAGLSFAIYLAYRFAPLSAWSLGPWNLGPWSQARVSTTIMSYDPLIIYIENFLSPYEVKYLKKLAEGKYDPSTIIDVNVGETLSPYRRSSTALLPRHDRVVHAVMSRAARFQGFTPVENVETLQATSYVVGQEYQAHYDLLVYPFRDKKEDGKKEEKRKGGGEGEGEGEQDEKKVETRPETNGTRTERATTIFAILEDSCGVDCGTQFPQFTIDWASEDAGWCEFVDCGEPKLSIRPRAGNAVFWKNLREDGSAHALTLHAGLPLKRGAKIGLNIWTRNGTYATKKKKKE